MVLPKGGTPTLWIGEGATVALRRRPAGRLVARVGHLTRFGTPRVLTVFERHGAWAGVGSELVPNGRLAWVRLDPAAMRVAPVDEAVVVDISDFRATLYERGRELMSFAVSVGRPGAETPTGRFAVTDGFRGGNLNPVYGCCALALSATQPRISPGWAGGDRLAIHGTSGPLGAAVSNGCVRAADRDVRALIKQLELGTPVTIHA